MEKINTKDNNKKKRGLIKKFIPFCKFKTNQNNLTNDKQSNDGSVSSYTRFCKSSTSVLVERGENKSRPQQDVYSFFLKKNEKEERGSTCAPENLLKSEILTSQKAKTAFPVKISYFKSIQKDRKTHPVKIEDFKSLEKDRKAPSFFLNLRLRDNNLSTLLPGREKAKMQLEELKKKFINLLMRDGEKSKAYKLFADSLKQIEYRTRENTKRKVFDFFTARKKHYDDLDQKQHKQKKEKKNKSTKISHRVEQDYYNVFLKNNILYQAVENVKPALELRRVRKGGTTYQVPAIVSKKRQERLAIKWIIEAAEKKKKKNKNCFSDCLVSEIMDAFNKIGQPRQRRDEQLKVAEFNRAYTRYRWW